jgi:addiction module HigA family antidote
MKTTTEEKAMKKRKRAPNHPGGILKRLYLAPMEITVSELSKRIGVSRKTVSKLVNERGSVTPDMALRLSRAFNTTPDLWLNLQKNYDLWQAGRKSMDWQRIAPFPAREMATSLPPGVAPADGTG